MAQRDLMSNYFKFYFWNFQRYYLGQLLLGQHSSSQLNYCWANILAQQYSSNIGPNNQYCSNIGCCNIAAMLLQYWSNIFVWTNIVWTNIVWTNIAAMLLQYWLLQNCSNIGPNNQYYSNIGPILAQQYWSILAQTTIAGPT